MRRDVCQVPEMLGVCLWSSDQSVGMVYGVKWNARHFFLEIFQTNNEENTRWKRSVPGMFIHGKPRWTQEQCRLLFALPGGKGEIETKGRRLGFSSYRSESKS